MTFKNIIWALWEQGPPKRFFFNFFISRNAWGLFSKRSHLTATGDPKVMYNTRKTAIKSAKAMSKRYDKHFSAYKCMRCDGYHLGKNKDNK